MIDTMIIPTKPFFVGENEALKKKVEQLEKEADWLAWQCETLSGHNPILRQGMSKKQWREAAKEAVQND